MRQRKAPQLSEPLLYSLADELVANAAPTHSGVKHANGNGGSSSSGKETFKTACLIFLAVAVVGLSIALGVVVHHAHTQSVSEDFLKVSPGSGLSSEKSCPSAASGPLVRDLERVRRRIVSTAAGAAIDWATYDADPEAHSGKRVHLTQTDFDNGTLRLRSPGLFVLQEDITFEPNADDDHLPRPDQPLYAGKAYTLGFFAAITVEASDICIDLNGFTLRASGVFALQQRFMSIIELASQPFLSTQGPAAFGDAPGSIVTAHNFVLENGTLGRSSHHGLHGNGARHVLLQDLQLVDYEVAAIALNGAKDVLIRRVHANGAFTRIPVIGTYSNARFLLPFAARVSGDEGEAAGVSAPHRAAVAAASSALQTLMAQVLADVDADGEIDAGAHPDAAALFAHPTGLDDGTSYGFLLHPLGVAVGAFWHRPVPEAGSDAAVERVRIENCDISHTLAQVIEVVALADAARGTIMGPAGDRLRLIDNAGRVQLFDEGTGAYVGNALADAQIALIAASDDVSDDAERKALFGTTNGGMVSDLLAWVDGSISLHELIDDRNYTYMRNGDTMFHVNKGVLGLRIDGARDVCLSDVRIFNVSNVGLHGQLEALPGEDSDEEASYVGGSDGGHPQQGPQYGYMGADARGIGVSGSDGVYLQRVSVDCVHAYMGNARGMDFFNAANGTYIEVGCSVSNISAMVDAEHADDVAVGDFANGPRSSLAIGVCVGNAAADSTYGAFSISVTNVTNRILDAALDISVDSRHEISAEHLSDEDVNIYEL